MKKINLRLGLRKKKLNDKGSTMIIVLIMASFVMILATVVTSTAMVNLKSQPRHSTLLRMRLMRFMRHWERLQWKALTRLMKKKCHTSHQEQ